MVFIFEYQSIYSLVIDGIVPDCFTILSQFGHFDLDPFVPQGQSMGRTNHFFRQPSDNFRENYTQYQGKHNDQYKWNNTFNNISHG